MRVLIVRVGAMGDVLHALPAVAALRAARPDWTIDWVVDERWAPLLVSEGIGPVVNGIQPVAIAEWKRRPLAWTTVRALLLFRRLRGGYDVVVDMQGTLRSAAIGWLAGGGRLVGYADPREGAARMLYGRPVQRSGAHVVEQGAALLGAACGVALTPVAAELPRSAGAESWAEAWVGGDRVCVLAPRAGWGAKQWPAARFGALAGELGARGCRVLVNAARADDALAAEVVAASGGAASGGVASGGVASGGVAEIAVCDVAGMIALLRRAAMVVGGDSGPTHLAAMLGVPLVALFGPTDPARNGPWGPGVKRVLRDPASVTSHRRVAEVERGLARVSVESVLEAVVSLEEEARARG